MTSYSEYLTYLKENNIKAPEWVKDWTRRLLMTDEELAGEHINISVMKGESWTNN